MTCKASRQGRHVQGGRGTAIPARCYGANCKLKDVEWRCSPREAQHPCQLRLGEQTLAAVSVQRVQAEVLMATQGNTLLVWLVPLSLGARLDNDLCFGGKPK